MFAGAGSYAGAAAFADGFVPAIGVAAGPRAARRGGRSRDARPAAPRTRARVPRSLRRQGDEARDRALPRPLRRDAAENERLVRDVYAEIERLAPAGFRYVTLVGDDGLSFTHVAFEDGEPSPLPGLAAFARFRAGLGERCSSRRWRRSSGWSAPTGSGTATGSAGEPAEQAAQALQRTQCRGPHDDRAVCPALGDQLDSWHMRCMSWAPNMRRRSKHAYET